MIYDDNDFMIIPDNALNLNQQENKLSSNESILNVGSREIKNAKNLGFYEILKINKKSDAIKPDTSILKNAICFAFPEGDNVNWKFRIDCSEFKSLNSKIFFGLEYTKIEQKNNIILVDDILRFTPVFPVNNENVTFSMSTLEDN